MLIAFEGLDQSGKATQARTLVSRFEQDGRTVTPLSFPDYETPIGRELRAALSGQRSYPPDVMQLLYVANRLEYRDRLEHWLRAGHVVVCDRYRASSVAYGEAQGLEPAWLEEIQRPLPPADVTVLLDIRPEAGVARKHAERDVYERDLALLARVRDSYSRQARQYGWVVVDGEQSKDAVSAAVWTAVHARLAPLSRPTRA
jgi:dTMP kinase